MNKLKKIMIDKEDYNIKNICDEVINVIYKSNFKGEDIWTYSKTSYSFWEYPSYQYLLNGYFLNYKSNGFENPYILGEFNEVVYPYGEIYYVCFNKRNGVDLYDMYDRIEWAGDGIVETLLELTEEEFEEEFMDKMNNYLEDFILPILKDYFEIVY